MRTRFGAAASILVAVLVGFLADLAGLQLPWLLGPMLASAALSISGVEVFASQHGRRAGQLLIGTTLGLGVTGTVFATLVAWAPIMILSALISIALTAFFSVFYARLGRLDAKTAYFALVPGGVSEMAVNAAKLGAQPEPIAFTQALRVALIVTVVPTVVGYLSEPGSTPTVASLAPSLDHWMVPVVLVIATAGVLVAGALRLSNPWVIGALTTIGLLSGLGLTEGGMPTPLFNAGQLFVGVVIGSRFKRDAIRACARLLLPATMFIFLSTALLLGYAQLLAQFSGMPAGTMILAVSLGGLAEMSSTAHIFNLGVVLVTGFHVTRVILVNSLAPQVWTLLMSAGFFSAVARLDHYLFRHR
ncbi:AbrB family transcriptional regulator [Devosia sp. A369]